MINMFENNSAKEKIGWDDEAAQFLQNGGTIDQAKAAFSFSVTQGDLET